MKLLVASLIVAPMFVFAGSTVCSTERLYYSSVRRDSGVQPLPNTVVGKVVIVYDGEVLLNYDQIQGLHPHGAPPFDVKLIGEIETLSKEGNQIAGATVFKQTAVLKKVDSLKPWLTEEIVSKKAICRQTWKMVP